MSKNSDGIEAAGFGVGDWARRLHISPSTPAMSTALVFSMATPQTAFHNILLMQATA
jgi:hypothetical protein